MVGNDVVDLADVDADASTYSPRFDARVFSDDERAWIEASPEPSVARWQLWAAKESAYKALKRLRPTTVFAPGCFEVRVMEAPAASPGRGQWVRARVTGTGASPPMAPGEALAVEIESNADRVHAVARHAGEPAPTFEISALPVRAAGGDVSASDYVRRRLVRKIAAALGVPMARISLDRRARVPVVLLDRRDCDIETSLSHHGRFVACAWSPRGVRLARRRAHARPRAAREVCA